jgi:hypothetical protein
MPTSFSIFRRSTMPCPHRRPLTHTRLAATPRSLLLPPSLSPPTPRPRRLPPSPPHIRRRSLPASAASTRPQLRASRPPLPRSLSARPRCAGAVGSWAVGKTGKGCRGVSGGLARARLRRSRKVTPRPRESKDGRRCGVRSRRPSVRSCCRPRPTGRLAQVPISGQGGGWWGRLGRSTSTNEPCLVVNHECHMGMVDAWWGSGGNKRGATS